MMMKNHNRWLYTVVIISLVSVIITVVARPSDRSLRVLNESGQKVELYWINPKDGSGSLMSRPVVLPGSVFNLNTFAGHEFEVREVPPKDGEVCATDDQTCRTSRFLVSDNDDQAIRITSDILLVHTDNKSLAKEEATDIIDSCQANAKSFATERATGSEEDKTLKAIDNFVKCVESGVATTLEKANEEIAFQATVRKGMAEVLENYTCADLSLPTSPDEILTSWTSDVDKKERTVHVKHKRPSSQIHVVENFISEEECNAMEESARPKLHKATVADGKGGSEFSPNRKAMQAGIKVHWSEEGQDTMNGHIATLSRRVYDYANHVLGLNIKENGQEDLMSIQYFGRGLNDTEPDRYTPHCDGDCTGLPHKHGTRMATMVMYCKIPDLGGRTQFRNSGVRVNGEMGSAVFFSYINPDEMVMDNGFTEHSGCPVLTGEKKIVTQWIRYGVDDENPWDSFNTLGIKRSDAMNQ